MGKGGKIGLAKDKKGVFEVWGLKRVGLEAQKLRGGKSHS